MKIDIIQSSVTGQWGYCPSNAPESFKKCLAYDDAPGFANADSAKDKAAADRSIDQTHGLEFNVIPNPACAPVTPGHWEIQCQIGNNWENVSTEEGDDGVARPLIFTCFDDAREEYNDLMDNHEALGDFDPDEWCIKYVRGTGQRTAWQVEAAYNNGNTKQRWVWAISREDALQQVHSDMIDDTEDLDEEAPEEAAPMAAVIDQINAFIARGAF